MNYCVHSSGAWRVCRVESALSDQGLGYLLTGPAHAECHPERGALFVMIEEDKLEHVERYLLDSWGNSLMALKMQKNAPCELALYVLKIPLILLEDQKRNWYRTIDAVP